jgi:lysophospholipase L1-like esterase
MENHETGADPAPGAPTPLKSEWTRNLLLVLGSALLVCAVCLAGDRLLGRWASRPELRGTMELIFPPNAEQTFGFAEFTYTARINSLGLRERELSSDPKVFRIAAIGDSYTYGWGVEAEQTWLRRLEDALRAKGYLVETVNMGKPGAGPPFYAELAEKALPLIQPDLVLVCVTQGNDLNAAADGPVEVMRSRAAGIARTLFPNTMRLIRDRRIERMGDARRQEMPPQKSTAEDNRRWQANTARDFHEKMTPENRARFDAMDPRVKEAFFAGTFNPYMVDLALNNPRIYSLPMNMEDPWIKSRVGNLAGYLDRIRRAAEEYGAMTAVLSLPDGPYVNKHAFEGVAKVGYIPDAEWMTAQNADEGIRRAAEKADLPFFTASPVFTARETEPDLFYELDGHLTPKGHALYAEAVAPDIERLIAPAAPREQGT